jgi:microcystin degradation protein MlrC
MGLAHALIAGGAVGAALGNIVDGQAARAAHDAGAGSEIRLALGARSGIPGDVALEASFAVVALSDGRFRATGPYFGGTQMEMGPSACLRSGGVDFVVTTGRAQMADREMFRQVGIDPETRPILGVKSSVHFRADFAPIAAAILTVAAPGPMAVDPAKLPWTRLAPGTRLSPLGAAFERKP